MRCLIEPVNDVILLDDRVSDLPLMEVRDVSVADLELREGKATDIETLKQVVVGPGRGEQAEQKGGRCQDGLHVTPSRSVRWVCRTAQGGALKYLRYLTILAY